MHPVPRGGQLGARGGAIISVKMFSTEQENSQKNPEFFYRTKNYFKTFSRKFFRK